MQHNFVINLIRTSKTLHCVYREMGAQSPAGQLLCHAGRKAHALEGNDHRLPADLRCASEHGPHTSTEANKIQKNARHADQGQKTKALLTFT